MTSGKLSILEQGIGVGKARDASARQPRYSASKASSLKPNAAGRMLAIPLLSSTELVVMRIAIIPRMAETGRAIAPVKRCAVYMRVNLNRGLRAFCFGRPAILFTLRRWLFSIRLRFRSAALVIFHVLAECADDALFATDSRFEFLVQASESLWSFPWKASSMTLVRSERVSRVS